MLAALIVAHSHFKGSIDENLDWGHAFRIPKVDVDRAKDAMLRMLGWRLAASAEELQAVILCHRTVHGPQPMKKRISLKREDAVLGNDMM